MFWQSLILHASVNKLVLGVFSPLVIDENVDIVHVFIEIYHIR
jgi:hypothetical protein